MGDFRSIIANDLKFGLQVHINKLYHFDIFQLSISSHLLMKTKPLKFKKNIL